MYISGGMPTVPARHSPAVVSPSQRSASANPHSNATPTHRNANFRTHIQPLLSDVSHAFHIRKTLFNLPPKKNSTTTKSPIMRSSIERERETIHFRRVNDANGRISSPASRSVKKPLFPVTLQRVIRLARALGCRWKRLDSRKVSSWLQWIIRQGKEHGFSRTRLRNEKTWCNTAAAVFSIVIDLSWK